VTFWRQAQTKLKEATTTEEKRVARDIERRAARRITELLAERSVIATGAAGIKAGRRKDQPPQHPVYADMGFRDAQEVAELRRRTFLPDGPHRWKQ
jgi:hypothetical protein